ncbi:MAG: tetratricopeptide repeat protein [Pyrinomonadaceae bacterium]
MNRSTIKTIVIFVSIVIVISVTASNAFSQGGRKSRRVQQLEQQAGRAYLQKDFRLAIERYAEAIVLLPTNPDAHFWKGNAHHFLQQNDLALSELDEAFKQGHSPLDIYKVRWSVGFARKNYDAALSDVIDGLKLEPTNNLFLIGAGDIYLAKGALPEALASYQRALVADPNNADLHYQVAEVHSRTGDADAQLASAKMAISKNTRFLGEALFLLGDAHQKRREMDDAIDAYTKALQSKPDIYLAYRKLATLYAGQSRFDEAIDISNQARKQFPGDGYIYTDISWYYSLANRHEDAVQAALAGVRYLPPELQYLAYTNLCRAYNDTAKYQSAVSACNTSLRLNSSDGEAQYYLGRAFELLGKPEEASKYYNKAVPLLMSHAAKNSESSDAYYLLGNGYYSDNQMEKAAQAYTRCLELSPRFVKAIFNLGVTRVAQRNKAAAMEQYNNLLPLDRALAQKLKAEIDKL